MGTAKVNGEMIRPASMSKALAVVLCTLSGGAAAQDAALDGLFDALSTAEGPDAQQIAGKIAAEWSKSGSPAADLLLTRGRDALDAGDTAAAIGHLTALTENAPDFAEGYNARATAYFDDGQYGPALADIRQVLALNPRHFGAMIGMALILDDIGSPSASLAIWREVERIYPASPEAARAIPDLAGRVEGQDL